MKTTRDEVYAAIDGERSYQNEAWPSSKERSVEGELVLLSTYVNGALQTWSVAKDNADVLRIVRKIAGIAVRCMENHGAPKR